MIRVRYQSRTSPNRVPCHGWDFKDENDLYTKSSRPNSPSLNWKQYVEWLIKKDPSCLRVWVNGEQVWQYHF